MSPEDAKSALKAHFQLSSLHNGMNNDDKQFQVDMAEIEDWEEDSRQWENWAEENGTGSEQHNDKAWGKRKRNEDAPVVRVVRPTSKRAPNRSQLKELFPSNQPQTLHLCRGNGVSHGGRFVPSGVPMGHSVTLSATQAQTVMDALSRGRLAMEACLRIIEHAHAAFDNEMGNVAEMQDVLQSWLMGAATRDSQEFEVVS